MSESNPINRASPAHHNTPLTFKEEAKQISRDYANKMVYQAAAVVSSALNQMKSKQVELLQKNSKTNIPTAKAEKVFKHTPKAARAA